MAVLDDLAAVSKVIISAFLAVKRHVNDVLAVVSQFFSLHKSHLIANNDGPGNQHHRNDELKNHQYIAEFQAFNGYAEFSPQNTGWSKS